MKKIKNFAIGLILTSMVALCPILCIACGGNADNNGKNIAKALGDSITIIKNHNAENTNGEEANSLATSSLDVEFLPIEESPVEANLVQLDYIKAIVESSKFKYTTSPFKATAVVSANDKSATFLSYNKFSIVDNIVTVEMYFTGVGSQDTDYQWMQIDYDFENNKVSSFELYEYVTTNDADEGPQETLSAYKYQNETLSMANEADDNYSALKNSIKGKGTELANTQEFAHEYDFTEEYNKVLII